MSANNTPNNLQETEVEDAYLTKLNLAQIIYLRF